MSWDAGQYLMFEAERNRPIHDLLARIPREGARTAIDLGCGPGNSTELLGRHLPDATVTGLDASPDMIEAARKRLPDVAFRIGDIADWRSLEGPLDLIFANAALQWVPDHATVLPRLVGELAPGGRLAVQMPDNLDEPAHRIMRDLAGTRPWATKLKAAAQARSARHEPGWYIEALRAAGARADVWRTTYHHQLAGGVPALVAWFKGTGLRPFLDPLEPDEQMRFLADYEDALAGAYPRLGDGCVLLPFPRLFFIAERLTG